MRASVLFAALSASAGLSFAGTLPPFTLNLSAFPGSYSVTGSTIASGLDFPYGMAMTSNGSILFGESAPQTPGGIEGGPSIGSVWSIARQPDGSYAAPQQIVGGLSGPVTDVRVAPDGTILVDSGAASGRTLTLYNSSDHLIGTLNFSYPTQNWDHSTGMSYINQLPNGSDQIFFIVGSEADLTKTTVQVATSGLFTATLNADSVYMVTVKPVGGVEQVVSGPTQIVTGVRNAYGLSLDASGDLVVGDNGQDGPHTPNELGADTLNIVPASGMGSAILDFGFPDSYTNFTTGQRVNGDPNAVGPLVAFTPTDDSNGVLQLSEGLSAMAFVPPGAMPFAGSEGGEFIGFHGTKDTSGPGNPDDAFLYYDFASGKYYPIVDGGTLGVGHLNTVIVSGNSVFIADMSTNGVVDGLAGVNSGAIYEFTIAAASAPEPASGALAAGAMAMLLLGAYARRRKATP